jgi:hypothetical protein
MQSLTVDSLRYGPLVPDSVFFRSAPPRSSRSRITMVGVKAENLRQTDLQQRRVTPTVVRVDSLDIDVLADRRTPPPPPRPPRPRVLWPARLAALGWVAGADSIVLRTGDVCYGELVPGRARPAEACFADQS